MATAEGKGARAETYKWTMEECRALLQCTADFKVKQLDGGNDWERHPEKYPIIHKNMRSLLERMSGTEGAEGRLCPQFCSYN